VAALVAALRNLYVRQNEEDADMWDTRENSVISKEEKKLTHQRILENSVRLHLI